MVDTIGAAVRGNSKSTSASRLWLLGAFHVTGAALTSAAMGAALGGLGSLLGGPWGSGSLVVVVALASIYLSREALGVPIPVIQRRQQVPEWWRSFYSAPTTAFLYGTGLGVGFLTHLTYGTFVVVAGAALVSGSPLIGALLCLPFGISRSIAAALAGGRRDLRSTKVGLEQTAEGAVPRVVNAIALGVVLVGALTTAF